MTDNWKEQEEKRLRAVRELEILDTAAEADFDDIVRLAAMIFKVPISAITIVDAHRQWYKSALGLDAREVARDISFCTYAIEQATPFIVENAKTDPRFARNPLVIDSPHLGFYAGVPLLNSEKLAIGTFCIMDHIPRAMTPEEIDVLNILAN